MFEVEKTKELKADVEEDFKSYSVDSFDAQPILNASLESLSIDHFKTSYLPLAIDPETLLENGRAVEQQLASLRFFDAKEHCPTNAGILMFGKQPEFYLPGAYIQYVRFEGEDMQSHVAFEKKFSGPLVTLLQSVDDFVKNVIIKERPVKKNSFQEEIIRNYPFWALRELMMNAIMHRNYESNSPTYIYEYASRIEIINPGGLFGDVNAQNFPNASDYRNVVLAEAMKVLGYVNRFNFGIKRAIEDLVKSGNGQPFFDLTLGTKFKVTIAMSSKW